MLMRVNGGRFVEHLIVTKLITIGVKNASHFVVPH
jgi:hypothetical protein